MSRAAVGLLVVLCGCGTAGQDEPDGAGGFAGMGGDSSVGGAGGDAGAGGEGGGPPVGPPDGSWENPFLIDALPFATTGDTLEAVSSDAGSYWPCAPQTVEEGPEVVYRLEVQAPGWLWASVDDVPGDAVDVDLHLLAEGSPDACVTRNDSWLGAPVQPGSYWLVVDTWTDASFAGPYALEVDVVTDAGMDCLSSPIACDGMLPPYVNLELTEAPGEAGCLPGMVRVEDFCVDRFEAIVVAMTNDGWAPLSPYAHPDDALVLAALSVEGAIPQGHISQIQAADACAMSGKRLCDDGEWLRACQGATGSTYPYGDVLEPGVCNDARACHPVVQYFESSEPWVWSELGHPCISQLPDGLASAGALAGCATEEGAMDMMGNLHEWTTDPAGTFRGGFYVDTVINGSGCLYATTAHPVTHHDYSTGFRCCADAIP